MKTSPSNTGFGLVGTGTLSHDVKRWWHLVRGKDDPNLKIGETNRLSGNGLPEYIWVLKDINFEVRQGEVLRIIGKNGAIPGSFNEPALKNYK